MNGPKGGMRCLSSDEARSVTSSLSNAARDKGVGESRQAIALHAPSHRAMKVLFQFSRLGL